MDTWQGDSAQFMPWILIHRNGCSKRTIATICLPFGSWLAARLTIKRGWTVIPLRRLLSASRVPTPRCSADRPIRTAGFRLFCSRSSLSLSFSALTLSLFCIVGLVEFEACVLISHQVDALNTYLTCLFRPL